jgi:hypothetical protein
MVPIRCLNSYELHTAGLETDVSVLFVLPVLINTGLSALIPLPPAAGSSPSNHEDRTQTDKPTSLLILS